MEEGELSPQRIGERLRTECFGRRVVYHRVLDSTNRLAMELAGQGEAEGTLVLAEEQTAGRGRLARRWLAPAGSSLLFSLILRPPLAPSQAPRLAMMASLACAQAIEEVAGIAVKLKWPNDLLVRGKKAGGILAEGALTGERLDYAVLGVGVNVNFSAKDIPQIAASATTLRDELGRETSRTELLVRMLEELEGYYQRMLAGVPLCGEYAWRMDFLGRRVEVSTPRGVVRGTAEGVDEDGALLLRREDGLPARIVAGEVEFSRPIA